MSSRSSVLTKLISKKNYFDTHLGGPPQSFLLTFDEFQTLAGEVEWSMRKETQADFSDGSRSIFGIPIRLVVDDVELSLEQAVKLESIQTLNRFKAT